MKRHKYQIAAFMMSVIMATGSLSGSVFATETTENESENIQDEDEVTSKEEEDTFAVIKDISEGESVQTAEEIVKEMEENAVETENSDMQIVEEDYLSNEEKEQTDVFLELQEKVVKETEGENESILRKEGNSALDYLKRDEQDDVISTENIVVTISDFPGMVECYHDASISVSVQCDLDVPYSDHVITHASDFTEDRTEYYFVPEGSGSGTIKFFDTDSGRVLKICNVIIEPLIADEASDGNQTTVCRGEYIWTHLYHMPTDAIGVDVAEGLSIELRDSSADMYEYSPGEPGYYSYWACDCDFAVKGEQLGDYSVSYYNYAYNNHPILYKITYHVIDHDYQESSIIKEATCMEDGLVEKKCSNCGDTITETIPATGHQWEDEYTVDKEATCTEEGSESIHCSACGEINEETVRAIPKKEHAYGDWTVTKKATCTEEGHREKVCADCNDKATETIPATGHIWNEDYTIDKEATCTEEGSESIHCSVCDVIQDGTSRTIPKTAHEYGDWTVTKDATCTEAGTKEKTCKDCNDKVTETIPAVGHKWDEDYTVDKEATYTEEGSESIHCSVCGEIKDGTSKPIAKLCMPMSILTVSGIVDKTYTGNTLTQSPVVKDGFLTLKEGTDYTVSYKNNTNAGTATVTITGRGNYTGTKTATFKINKAAQSIAVKASAASIAVGKTATVSVTGNKGTKSYKSSNTAVATVNAAGTVTAKKAGTVTITATSAATANYNAASKTVSIKVVPAATSSITAANQATGIKLTWKKVAGATGYKVYRGTTLIKTIKSGATVTCTDTKANANGTKYTFKVIPTASTGNGLAKTLTTYRVARPAVSSVKNSASKKMTVRWNKNAKANGYQIQYSTNKKFAKGNKTANVTKAATVSKVIGSLTKGKTYYVRIRTYKTVGKAKFWSAWSPAKTVKIKK